MTTFYNRDPIRITERWLSIGNRRYPIGQLHNLRRARGPADHAARRAALTAMLSLPVSIVIGPHIPAPAATIVIVVFVVLPATVAALRARRYRRAYLLWADYQYTTTQLYQTRDETEFGKISRALVRARAHGRGQGLPPSGRGRLAEVVQYPHSRTQDEDLARGGGPLPA